MKSTTRQYFIGTIGLIMLIQILFLLGFRFPAQPSPIEVATEMVDVLRNGTILPDILASSSRVLVGVGLATAIGVSLGILLAEHRRLGDYVRPAIEIIRPIPPIAWIPISILIFGIGNESAYFIVFLGAFFPIFTNTYFGISSLPGVLRRTSKSYELSHLVFVQKILLPWALPSIFSGIRIAIGMGWMSVIAAELAGVQGGLGYFIQYNRLLLNFESIIAGMLYIGLAGTVFIAGLSLIEKRVIPWHE